MAIYNNDRDPNEIMWETVKLSDISNNKKMSFDPSDYLHTRKFRKKNGEGYKIYEFAPTYSISTGCMDRLNKEIYDNDFLYDRNLSEACIKEGSREEGYMWISRLVFEQGCYWLLAYNQENGSFEETDYPLYQEAKSLEIISAEDFEKYRKKYEKK